MSARVEEQDRATNEELKRSVSGLKCLNRYEDDSAVDVHWVKDADAAPMLTKLMRSNLRPSQEYSSVTKVGHRFLVYESGTTNVVR